MTDNYPIFANEFIEVSTVVPCARCKQDRYLNDYDDTPNGDMYEVCNICLKRQRNRNSSTMEKRKDKPTRNTR